jgi:hypothetical protein
MVKQPHVKEHQEEEVCLVLQDRCLPTGTSTSTPVVTVVGGTRTSEGRENMDPLSGKNNQYFFFYADVEEEFS